MWPGGRFVGRCALHGLVLGWLLLVIAQAANLWFAWPAADTVTGMGGLLTYPTVLVAGVAAVGAGQSARLAALDAAWGGGRLPDDADSGPAAARTRGTRLADRGRLAALLGRRGLPPSSRPPTRPRPQIGQGRFSGEISSRRKEGSFCPNRLRRCCGTRGAPPLSRRKSWRGGLSSRTAGSATSSAASAGRTRTPCSGWSKHWVCPRTTGPPSSPRRALTGPQPRGERESCGCYLSRWSAVNTRSAGFANS